MARIPPPSGTVIDRFRFFPLPEGVDPREVAECDRRWKLRRAALKLNRVQTRAKTPTETRENEVRSPVATNNPVDYRKSTKNIEAGQRKPHGSKNYKAESIDSGISSLLQDVKGSPKVNVNPSGTKNLTGKRSHQGQRGVAKNCTNKENESGAANHSHAGHASTSNTSQTRRPKNRSVVSNSASKIDESSIVGKNISVRRDPEYIREKRRQWLDTYETDGTWIKCCFKKCGKWRLNVDYEDPSEVPKKWYCHMNADPDFASCDVPEEKIPRGVSKNLIENAYHVGSIVWARLDGFPWWPSMVDDCPDQLRFCQLEGSSLVPVKYHVVFFSPTKPQRTWVRAKDLKSYVTNLRETVVKKTIFKKIDYKQELDESCTVADEAVQLSLRERLNRFCWVAQSIQKDSTSSRRKRPYRSVAMVDNHPGEEINSVSSTIIDRDSEPKRYSVGDIVWAHPNKFPWWPAMIDDCPFIRKHYRFPESPREPMEYYVVYFNEKKLEFDWLPERDIKNYEKNPRNKVVRTTRVGRRDYKREINNGCALAREAQRLSLRERIDRFGVSAREAELRAKIVKKPKKSAAHELGQSFSSAESSAMASFISRSSLVANLSAMDLDAEIVSILGPNETIETVTLSRVELSGWKNALVECPPTQPPSPVDNREWLPMSLGSPSSGSIEKSRSLDFDEKSIFISEPRSEFTTSDTNSSLIELANRNEPKVECSHKKVTEFLSRASTSNHTDHSFLSTEENHYESPVTDRSSFSSDPWQLEIHIDELLVSSATDNEWDENSVDDTGDSNSNLADSRFERNYRCSRLFS